MKTITTMDEVNKAISNPFTLFIIKTKTCSTCAMITPHLKNQLVYLDRFPVYEIFVDEFEAFRGEYVVFSVPTVLIFSEGKEILRESRFINTHKVNRLITSFFDE